MTNSEQAVRKAAERWVSTFNAIPLSLIEKLKNFECETGDEINEATPFVIGSAVHVFDSGSGDEGCCGEGKIVDYVYDEYDERVTDMFIVEVDGNRFEVSESCIENSHDYPLPIWGFMWTFGDASDVRWLNVGGLELMAECGFRIFEQEDLGYVFGIDGAGYDFYADHWIPLYEARGLQWHHDEAAA